MELYEYLNPFKQFRYIFTNLFSNSLYTAIKTIERLSFTKKWYLKSSIQGSKVTNTNMTLSILDIGHCTIIT